MDYKKFSKKELVNILDLIQATLACKNEIDLKCLLEKAKELISGKYGICGAERYYTKGLSEEEWLNVYTPERLYGEEPIIWHQYNFFGAQLRSDTYKRYVAHVSPEFIYNAGRQNYFEDHHKAILHIIAPHFHQALCGVFKESQRKIPPALTEREKEIICWMKVGKTNWEISVILNITERTVKFHLQNIKRKLNVVNKAHAVAVAIEQGLED